MKSISHPILRRTEKIIKHLLVVCRKDGPIYKANPRPAAQVNRTAKWLLNAVAQLKKEPAISSEGDPK